MLGVLPQQSAGSCPIRPGPLAVPWCRNGAKERGPDRTGTPHSCKPPILSDGSLWRWRAAQTCINRANEWIHQRMSAMAHSQHANMRQHGKPRAVHLCDSAVALRSQASPFLFTKAAEDYGCVARRRRATAPRAISLLAYSPNTANPQTFFHINRL